MSNCEHRICVKCGVVWHEHDDIANYVCACHNTCVNCDEDEAERQDD